MAKQNILKEVLSTADAIYDSILKFYNAEFTKIIVSAEKLSQHINDQKKNTTLFEVFDTLSDYQAEFVQWLEEKIEQTSKLDNCVIYWPESLHSFEKSIGQIDDLVNESFDDSIFFKTIEDNYFKAFNKIAAKYSHRFINFLQKVLKKNQAYQSEGRRFSTHNLIHIFFLAPVSKFLLEFQLKSNVIYYNNLETLKIINEKFKDKILVTEKLEHESYWEEIDFDSISDICTTYINELNDHFNKVRKELTTILQATQNVIEQKYQKYQESYAIAGSRLLPIYKFSAGKYIRFLSKLEKHSETYVQKWDQYGQVLCDEWIKDLELSSFQLKIAHYYFETQFILKNSLDSKIKPFILEVRNKVNQVSKTIKPLKDLPQSELKSRLKKEKHLLTKELHTKYLPNLIDVLTQANLEKVINILGNKVSTHLDELNDLHTIITDYSQKHFTPDFKYDKIKFKELIQFEILGSSDGFIDKYADKLHAELERLKRKISNIDQVVEFNLEAAIDMLDDESIDKSDEAHQVAVSGLERTLNNLDDINEDLDTFLNNATTKIASIATDLQQDIQKLGDNEHILQLRIRLAHAQTKEKITEFRNIIWSYIKTIIPKVWRILLKSIRKIRKSYRHMQRLSGLASTRDQDEYAIFDFITEYKSKFKKLPFIYQRLFSTEPLDDQRFFIGRNTQFNKIQSTFERFQSGQPASIVIVGEKGNGKTSLIYFAGHDIFAGHKIHSIDFRRSVYDENELKHYFTDTFNLAVDISFETLIEKLLEIEEKQIVVLENLHNLFLRTINGFNAIEKLMLMISKLQENYFWVVTSGLYGWEYLDKVINISSYFHDIIELSSLKSDDIQQLIDTRHKASGYGLNFLSSAKFERNRTYRKLKSDADKQAFLSDVFFKNLAEDSNGNIKAAMQLWLSAINHVEDEDISINTEFNLNHQINLNLTYDEYFTLAAFIQHEYLTTKEHANIFHQPEEKSELIVNRLHKKGLLDLYENKYVINTFVYRPIIKNLKFKNILT